MPEHFELKDGEEVLQEDKAFIVKRWYMGKGGKLILTNQRLLFTNRKNGVIEDVYDLKNILPVEKASRFMIIPFLMSFPVGFLAVAGPISGLALLVIMTSLMIIKKSVRITSKGRDPIRYGVGRTSQWLVTIEEQRKAAS